MSLIEYGWFASHSGFQLPWKVNCDALTDEDLAGLARIVAQKFIFSRVYGVPTGGIRFADACRKHIEPDHPTLIVDDVLTTGRAMNVYRERRFPGERVIGVVIFARGLCPSWIWPIFTVNEWSQSRGTGLG